MHTFPLSASTRPGRVVVIALAFGLLTGLGEGTGLLTFQKLKWLNWSIAITAVTPEILWVSPLFDCLLFGAAGLLLAGLWSLVPRRPVVQWSFFVFCSFMFFDWLSITGKVKNSVALVLAVGLAAASTRWFAKHAERLIRSIQRSLPWLGASTLLIFASVQGGGWLRERIATSELPPPSPGSPNILVIVLDTVRADHLSLYGYRLATTPNLERFAAQGTVFEEAFSSSSWTVPSHVSLLTGHYPREESQSQYELSSRFPTLPEEFARRGYRTGGFSGNTFHFTRQRGFARGFLHFEDFFHSISDMASRTIYGRKFCRMVLTRLGFMDIPGRKTADQVNREALNWIDAAKDRPFFVFLNYFDTHDPYLPPEPYRSRFSVPPNPGGKPPGGVINELLNGDEAPVSQAQLITEQQAYDGALSYLDDWIGKLLAALEERGLVNNTIVVITADHGESFGEHGITHGKTLYREVIHVPLMIRWPGHVPAGLRIRQPVTNAALSATLVDLLSPERKITFPGPPLTQLWKTSDSAASWPDPIAELEQKHFDVLKKFRIYYGDSKSLITDRWQYIQTENAGDELYDWDQDPIEVVDRVNDPDASTVRSDLRKRLSSQIALPKK